MRGHGGLGRALRWFSLALVVIYGRIDKIDIQISYCKVFRSSKDLNFSRVLDG